MYDNVKNGKKKIFPVEYTKTNELLLHVNEYRKYLNGKCIMNNVS